MSLDSETGVFYGVEVDIVPIEGPVVRYTRYGWFPEESRSGLPEEDGLLRARHCVRRCLEDGIPARIKKRVVGIEDVQEDCYAVGFSGEGRCLEPAGPSGFCSNHGPESPIYVEGS